MRGGMKRILALLMILSFEQSFATQPFDEELDKEKIFARLREQHKSATSQTNNPARKQISLLLQHMLRAQNLLKLIRETDLQNVSEKERLKAEFEQQIQAIQAIGKIEYSAPLPNLTNK